jgi:hypothetical protein
MDDKLPKKKYEDVFERAEKVLFLMPQSSLVTGNFWGKKLKLKNEIFNL